MAGVRRSASSHAWWSGRGRGSTADLDLVGVVAEQDRGWILETICRHLTDRVEHGALHYLPRDHGAEATPLPAARSYFFSHYGLYLRTKDDPRCRAARSLVWFTHPSYAPEEGRSIARGLRSCTRVISGSTTQAEVLIGAGFPRRKVAIIPPGSDPDRFRGHVRGSGAVGLCSRYYPRKSGDLMADIAEASPHRQFRLLGPTWRRSPAYPRMASLPNFEVVELGYEDYPSFYDGVDVFVSPSQLEGGPIPLIEAMMANAVPVATRTGFAPDLIRHGENGFICDVDAPASTFAALIDDAYALTADVRPTVEHLTWDAFARSVLAIALPERRP